MGQIYGLFMLRPLELARLVQCTFGHRIVFLMSGKRSETCHLLRQPFPMRTAYFAMLLPSQYYAFIEFKKLVLIPLYIAQLIGYKPSFSNAKFGVLPPPNPHLPCDTNANPLIPASIFVICQRPRLAAKI